jgi:hypothetical protein
VSGDILIKDHQTIASKISDHSMVLINIDRKMAAEGGIAMEMPKFINVS